MTVTLNLTDEQVVFLRQFATNQKSGAKDNIGTHKPLHIVQTKVQEYVFDGGESGYKVFFSSDSQNYYKNEVELVADISSLEAHEIIPYDDAVHEEINGTYIIDYDDYFEAYGVTGTVVSVVDHWRDVSYHFTLVEAKKYIKYQNHNLKSPRTFTVSPGYANKGDYEPFWDLLMTIGTQVNEESLVIEQ